MTHFFENDSEEMPEYGIQEQIQQLWFSLSFLAQLHAKLPVEDILSADMAAELLPGTRVTRVKGYDTSDWALDPQLIEYDVNINKKTFIEIGLHSFLIHWGSRIEYPSTFVFWIDPLYWVYDRNRKIEVPRQYFTASVN